MKDGDAHGGGTRRCFAGPPGRFPRQKSKTGGPLAAALLLLCSLGASFLASGCNVADSSRMTYVDVVSAPAGCNSELGFYALPKAYLHVRVGKNAANALDFVATKDATVPVEVNLHPDPAFVYCLNFRSSPLSDDKVDIVKAPSGGTDQSLKTPFLAAVTVNATDQTSYIVQALIRAATVAIGGRTFVGTATTEIFADVEYDPFDQRESSEVNERLSKLGYCLILDGYTYSGSAQPEQYCSVPKRFAGGSSAYAKAYALYEGPTGEPPVGGIFYKPRMPYRLSIYRKSDPGGPDRWLLAYTTTVNLENI